ncbi:MAG: hypothetical protein H6741_33705 [Alphaproteobacteria bacterium]|nr:hypothetical protein [Alphaproteobacteria bacterium]
MLKKTLPLCAALALTLSLGCKDDGPVVDSGEPVVDADGDGIPVEEDCDDNDEGAYPGAEELCDGVDNDCDGEIDNGASDMSTYYGDADGDGYGDADAAVQACEAPEGAVENADDCDDADGAVNPDADELCDGVDNNCDGVIDEDSALDAGTWYADLDGDGYGDAESTQVSCEPGPDYISDDTDCDDTDASVYPGAPEVWYDDVDSDCDGAPDPDVCEDVPEGIEIPSDPTCTYTPDDPSTWSIGVEWNTDPSEGWSWSAGSSYTRVMMTPMVGQLTDDNGDGLIDEGDVPDIAFNTFSGGAYSSGGYLRVISGDGSGEHFSLNTVTWNNTTYNIAGSGGIALGDIEGDGSPDILTTTSNAYLVALEYDGTVKWVASQQLGNRYTYPSLADMDADGTAEIIAGEYVFDIDGNVLMTAPADGLDHAFAADLDNDGMMEHIGGNAVTALDGTVLWQDTSVSTGFAAVMDWDGDGYGDVLNQRSGVLTVFDTWGTQIFSTTFSGSANGAPCVGDLDGDGQPEVAIASSNALTAIENDGSVMWSVGSTDGSSSGTPCTIWDFNGDGAFEVLLGDERDFYIRDGATGAALLSEPNHASGTIREQPVPVDVDRDGNTEIVLANNDYGIAGWDGVYVLGEVNDEWTTTRTTWNQGSFWSGNINDDMSIPTDADMPWELENTFRSQRSPTADPLASQDFQVSILGACEDCDAGTADIWVAVENGGATWGPAGIDVALYADDGGTWTLLEVQQTAQTIDAGERLPPMTFTVNLADIGADGLIAVVDDDGSGASAHNECTEDNNDDAWAAELCAN